MTAVISKTIFEGMGMCHQDYQPFGQKNCQDSLATVTHYTEGWKVSIGSFHTYSTFCYIAAYVGHIDSVFHDDLE